MVLIGADGGGTKTVLVACDEKGTVLGKTECPGVNYNAIGKDAARENLRQGVSRLLSEMGRSDFDCLCVGLSALDEPASLEETAEFAGDVFDPKKLLLVSDAYVGLVGATGFAPGIMIISGTGSMGTALDEKKNELVAGGYGYLLGDPGSGFDIGRRAFLAAAQAEENGCKSALLPIVCAHFGVSSPRKAIPILYGPGFAPSDLAALAKFVDEAAQQGDREAIAILREAGRTLTELVFSLIYQAGTLLPIYCYGSVITKSETVRAAFQEEVLGRFPLAKIEKPRLTPVMGALLCAARREGLDTEAIASALTMQSDGSIN
jgi:N-acetylglucosamine kinase-like BadF-type ATPase